jgi:hypothetical protein
VRGFWRENRGLFTQRFGHHGQSQIRLSVTSLIHVHAQECSMREGKGKGINKP